MEHMRQRLAAILATILLGGISSVAASGPRWFLMARHGECVEIESLRRKVPDLADVHDPYAFAEFMRQKGHVVTTDDMPEAKGRAVEVTVPEKELFLVFVTSDICRNSQTR